MGVLTFWLFGLGFLFLLVAFGLGILLLASNRVGHGVALLVCSVISFAACGLLFIVLIPVLSFPLVKKHQQQRITDFMKSSPAPHKIGVERLK